jgi:hypothetical protein
MSVGRAAIHPSNPFCHSSFQRAPYSLLEGLADQLLRDRVHPIEVSVKVGFRFRRSVKLLPGLRVNLSRSGASISLGGGGATINLGRKGTKATIGIPGTGISYQTKLGSTWRTRTQAKPLGAPVTLARSRPAIRCLGAVVFGLLLAVLWFSLPPQPPSVTPSSAAAAQARDLNPPAERGNGARHVERTEGTAVHFGPVSTNEGIAPAQVRRFVTVSREANIRSGPGIKYAVLMIANRGQVLSLFREQAAWIEIGQAAPVGWIAKKLTDPSPSP